MWQLKFDQHLFDGETEGEQLKHMIAALGMPPSEFVLQGRLGVREVWFDDEGSSLVIPAALRGDTNIA
jgi:hypothetical protein